MATTHLAHLDERIPARIRRAEAPEDEDATLCEVTVERFMGVIVRPVPPVEMHEIAGRFQHGGKVMVQWPDDRDGWWAVSPGDQLEVEGRSLTIRRTRDFPVCYAEIYVDGE